MARPSTPVGQSNYATDDPFVGYTLPPGDSMITSTPIDVRRKAPLVRRTKPRPTSNNSPLMPITSQPKRALVKRAGPPSAYYPIAICTKPASPAEMLAAGTSTDSQENIQPIDNTSGIKRYFHEATGNNHSDGLTDSDNNSDTEPDTPPAKKSKRATQAALVLHRRRIVEHTKPHLHAKLATQAAGAFPTGLTQDTLLVNSWLSGFSEVATDLQLDPKTQPAEDDLSVLKQAVSTWRCTAKGEGAIKVVDILGFKKGCGKETSLEIITQNRELYHTMFSKFAAWTYAVRHIALFSLIAGNTVVFMHNNLVITITCVLRNPW
ncbi:hypothetical protein HWV62_19345 [Athelia sp. TMB]|nr:hypothetical protein HWV62_19345 [Athelia sp. TMB]